MNETATEGPTDCLPPESLSPIQRSYLVGDQEGLELRGPARYYVGCDVSAECLPGIGDRLRRLVRANTVLRVRPGADLSLTVLPPDAARRTGVEVRRVADADFETANETARREFVSESSAFDGWPQLRAVAVASGRRARLHLAYALWLMDAASLRLFLAALVCDGGGGSPGEAERAPAETAVRPPRGGGAAASRRDPTDRARRFWRERAAALAGPAELPLRPDWRQAGPAVSHRRVTVETAVAERIAAAARDHGLTPPMVYLAAYGSVLGRLGGGAAHTVTVLYSRGTRPVTYDTLGNDGTTMPLEVPATTGRSFAETARTVQSRFLAQALHGSLGGAEITRLGDPAADPRRLPHPFTFTALDADSRGEAAIGFRRRFDEVQLRVPQVLIDHQVFLESDGSVRLGFDWRADAFDAGFVEDFADRYADFVRELAADRERWTRPPGRALHPPRRSRPAEPRPAPARPGGGAGGTLHERVLRRAAEDPAAPAVHDEHGTLGYGALAAAARAVADRLTAAGARPGDRVAVHLPRGRGQVVAVLGSLLAGCVYIPLDHTTPDGRLERIVRRGGVRFGVTDGSGGAADRWAARGVTPVALPPAALPPVALPAVALPTAGPDAPAVPAAAPAAPRPAASARPGDGPAATAYIIFTSGSTGEPKGVVVSHQAALNTIDAVNDGLGLGPGDRVLSVSSIGFDLSVYDVFGPLLRGGSVVMLSEETARNPASWAELIGRHGVTVWNSAPALASLLAEEGAAAPSVRAFLLSGDWIPLTLPDALRLLAPAAEVISLGGATEGSIWSVWHRVREEDRTGRSIPYGKALPGQEILVLDTERGVCPDWHIGEIHIAGAGVADGYVNDPEKTGAAFLDDPVFGRMYRTGDRGRRHPGGVVEFLGRTDTQVKLNGHRVELGEIEHVLANAPGVRRCAVCVRGEGRRRRLVAYLTLAADAPPTWRRDADAALRNALPRYMVPDALVELDEIPLTRNGKTDRRRLETLPHDEDPAGGAPAPPASLDLHGREVASCWQEVLGEPAGGDGFFEAGGSSYDAIRLLSLLRGRYGYDVPFGAFMADPTVPGLASLCRGARPPGERGVWTFRPRSGGTPRIRLVLFPPVGGGVSCYHGLIRELAGDVDVHVVGFDGPVADAPGPRPTLTGLARQCLERLPAPILSDQVPRVFGGWSFGGALAFEAARICGEPVARVVVVDTPVSAAARGGGEAREPTLEGFLGDVRETSGVVIDAAHAATDPALRGRFEVYRQNMTSLRDWVPRPAPAPVVELRAAAGPAEPDAGAWSGLARVEKSISLAGGHFEVFAGDNVRRVKDAIEGVDV